MCADLSICGVKGGVWMAKSKKRPKNKAALLARKQQSRLDVVRWRVEEQFRTIEALDRKLATAFGLSAVVLGLIAALAAGRAADMPWAAWGLLIGVVTVFLATAVCTIFAYNPHPWDIKPSLRAMQKRAASVDTDLGEFLRWSSDQMTDAYYSNQGDIARKGGLLRWVFVLSGVQIVLIASIALTVTVPACV